MIIVVPHGIMTTYIIIRTADCFFLSIFRKAEENTLFIVITVVILSIFRSAAA